VKVEFHQYSRGLSPLILIKTLVPNTSGKRDFYPPPLVPKLFGPGLKGALVPVRAAGARPAPSPGS
jgi:hypothetical protein